MFDKHGKYFNKIKNKKIRESVTKLPLPGGLAYPAIHADYYEKLEKKHEALRLRLKNILKDMKERFHGILSISEDSESVELCCDDAFIAIEKEEKKKYG